MTAIVRALLALALLSAMSLGCGGSDEEQAAEPTESQVAAGDEETTPADETMPADDMSGDDMTGDTGDEGSEDYGDDEGMPE